MWRIGITGMVLLMVVTGIYTFHSNDSRQIARLLRNGGKGHDTNSQQKSEKASVHAERVVLSNKSEILNMFGTGENLQKHFVKSEKTIASINDTPEEDKTVITQDKNKIGTVDEKSRKDDENESRGRHGVADRKCYRSHGPMRIEVACKEEFSFDYDDVQTDPAVIETDELPDDPRLMPEIGNGHIATVIHSDTICMNGLYNGGDVSSHRARIPSVVSFIATDVMAAYGGPVRKKYVLDMRNGMFRERFYGDDFRVEIRTYAHRKLTRVMAVEVEIDRHSLTNFTINFHLNSGNKSEDIKFSPVVDKDFTYTTTGETLEAEYPDIEPTTPVALVYDYVFNNITLPPFIQSETVYFFAAVGVNKTEATYYHQKAGDLFVNDTFRHEHEREWEELWERGRVDVAGDNDLATVNYASLYYLLSSLPIRPDEGGWSFMGLSPGGLAHGYQEEVDYAGHVFWDQDTWMFPPIMLLHSDIGRLIVQSRILKLDAAKALAEVRGYPGAVYPWESAYTGLPTSPSETCSTNEIHISGDVQFALRQYFLLTDDIDFLTSERGAEAMVALATFWANRVTLNSETNQYEILDVMGPDEYHYHRNNSVYTNTIARISLQTGQLAMRKTGRIPPRQWQNIMDNMYIPFDTEHQYHPEYDGYSRGTEVKQGDVILIGFPLMAQSSSLNVQRNDLQYYASMTPSGPAMTWGMFSTSWVDLGNLSLADRYFYKQFGNIQKPFYTWTENADGSGAVNFHTGIGGYLQSVLYGYGGFRINEHMLIFNPELLPAVASWSITGLDYRGNSFNFGVGAGDMNVTLIYSTSPVDLYIFSSNSTQNLSLNNTITLPRQRAALINTKANK